MHPSFVRDLDTATRRARVAMGMLALMALGHFWEAVVRAIDPSGLELELLGPATMVRGLLQVGLVVSSITFSLWLYQAHRNVTTHLGAKTMTYPSAFAVATFFIPVVNLVLPLLAMRELYRASDPEVFPPVVRQRDNPVSHFRASARERVVLSQRLVFVPLVPWWVSWVTGRLLDWWPWFVNASMVASDGLKGVAALLAMLVVHGMDRRQRERAARLVALVTPGA